MDAGRSLIAGSKPTRQGGQRFDPDSRRFVKFRQFMRGYSGWDIETALGELKTHLRGPKIVLRSKTPDLVRQEFIGLLMVRFAIRGLMHEAALKAGEDPDRLSFIHAVRVIRRKLSLFLAISPSQEARAA
jgi:hypothetical protein